MIELAPMDVAPPSETPPDATPGPKMTEAEPEVVEQQQVIPVPGACPRSQAGRRSDDAAKAETKPKKIVKEEPKPVVKPTHEPPAPRTSAPPRAAAASQTSRLACVERGGGVGVAQLLGRGFELGQTLSGSGAGAGEQGTVRLALTIDRGGHVVSARVIGSSGSSTLDQAALDMARHASGRPLPPEMGSSVSLTVPIRYSIN